MKLFILSILFLGLFLITSSACFAQSPDPANVSAKPPTQASGPSAEVLSTVAMADAGRLMSELDAIVKMLPLIQGQRAWWEDACKSTPECGGPKPEAQK